MNAITRSLSLQRLRELPSGTSVVVTLDDGVRWYTETRSEPWQLGSGDWVVSLVGKSGGYDLGRVSPTAPAAAPQRPNSIAVTGAVAFLREAWKSNDGAEGDSVRLVCGELEQLQRDLEAMRGKFSRVVYLGNRISPLDTAEHDELSALLKDAYGMASSPRY